MNGEVYLQQIIDAKIPHRVTYSGATVTILFDSGEKTVLSEGDFTPKELAFIGWVKREIISASKQANLPDRKPIFTQVKRWHSTGEVGDMVEIDISAAYWETANKIGLLSGRVYNAGMSLRKEVRLVAFGAAAAQKKTFVFDGERYVDIILEENQYGRRAYFYVASIVSVLLNSIANDLPGEVAVVWVDAIICSPGFAPQVQRRIFDAGYHFKTIPLINCRFEISSGARTWTVTEKESGRSLS